MISKKSETHSNVDKFSDTLLDGSSPKIQKQKMLPMKQKVCEDYYQTGFLAEIRKLTFRALALRRSVSPSSVSLQSSVNKQCICKLSGDQMKIK